MVRRFERVRSTAMVGIIHDGRRNTAYLRDFSADGVCLDGVRQVMAGDRLRLHCKGAVITAEVRWVRGPRAGLCFVPDCPPSEKARFLSAVSRGLKPASAARIYGFSEMA
ncbi:hypothetical protein ROE7235_02218 [Roseibaca ekhonensis]|uniref:PilZ domain-containing protein n=1 Tax=Roseinatronobacter ekhonensis TaxID=254356 RepID=A0A3B0MS68_9RHOB|nr:PilZ domain-containing protein [Roseibaca ekhonensis]SUZ32459.1 hypothetical protein ROE7235_02218 [Roseibaca ekhonensis]